MNGTNTKTVGTKIIATLGPATSTIKTIEGLIRAGTDAVRLNFSHGSREEHERMLRIVQEASEHLDAPVAIIGDLCGPKIRLLEVEGDGIELAVDQELRIIREAVIGNSERVATNHPELIDDIQVGHRVLIDDGTILLRVIAKDDAGLSCRCEIGGTLKSRKGINLPDTHWRGDSLTDKDREDAAWAARKNLDYIAFSFVRSREDVEQLRDLLNDLGAQCRIISKIETRHAIDNIDEIIESSDGIMVARGDLGVEIDVATVPRHQKDITARCRRAGKVVIIATQMLQSMVESPTPTRAEVSDVANAIYDDTDAVMLSAETSVGEYPLLAVETLTRVAIDTEAYDQDRLSPVRVRDNINDTAIAVAGSVCSVANDIGAKAILVWTKSGALARLVSKYRPDQPTAALTTSPAVCRRASLYYGIVPLLVEKPSHPEDRISMIDAIILERGWATTGDLVVVASGPQSLPLGNTGSIIIHTIKAH